MNDERRREIMNRLVPEESLRTSAIPTVRNGRRLFVTAVTFDRSRSEAGGQPDLWFAEDRDTGDVVGFGDPELWCVVPGNWLETGERHRRAVPAATFDHPRDAARIMGSSWTSTSQAFFDGTDPGATERLRVDQAARYLIPAALAPWIFACCSDFWTWLETGTTA